MNYSDLLNTLKAELERIRSNGQSTVDIEALQKYIELGMSNKPTENNLELQKLEQQKNLAHLDARTKHQIEMFKSVIEAGREALNALILINGGGVVALLGFLGATISKGLPATLGLQLAPSILYFGIGVLLGALSFGLRYVTQFSYAYNRIKAGHALNLLANSIAATGYILFGFGIYTAYNALTDQFTPI